VTVSGNVTGARDATVKAHGGALALDANLTGTGHVILDANGTIIGAGQVTGDLLTVTSQGTIDLVTSVNRLDLINAAASGGITVHQVGAVAIDRLSLSNAADGA